MKDEIAMCCDTPLIWTFMFSGTEWYCKECKGNFPMMNVESIKNTTELESEREKNVKEFRDIAKDCIPSGMRKPDECAECKEGEDHSYHASEEEAEKSRTAYAKLT